MLVEDGHDAGFIKLQWDGSALVVGPCRKRAGRPHPAAILSSVQH